MFTSTPRLPTGRLSTQSSTLSESDSAAGRLKKSTARFLVLEVVLILTIKIAAIYTLHHFFFSDEHQVPVDDQILDRHILSVSSSKVSPHSEDFVT